MRRRTGLSLSFVVIGFITCALASCGDDSEATGVLPPGGGDASNGGGNDGPVFGENDGSGGLGDASNLFDAACAATTVAARRAPANILFIVDRSGSMNCNPPPTQTSAQCEQFPQAT